MLWWCAPTRLVVTLAARGLLHFTPAHPWGLVSLDWSVAKAVWMANGRNRTNCEAVSVEALLELWSRG